MAKNEKIVCRCNDVTEEEIELAIDEGLTDLESLRKHLRIGMGACQGRTCMPLVRKILAEKTGKPIEEIKVPRTRAPLMPLPIHSLIGKEKNKEK
ncbi:MAG TPA: (2Fe-2S)-binding protein [Thermoplasmata archaeon]|nr:(2Fe-2S)-binding protein [Thermoplasmata archaeon]HIH97952.1 (2Fe-2S)-binding protein [Thermoplasmata archaeon]